MSPDRVRVYALALSSVCLIKPIEVLFVQLRIADWTVFWSAGATVGSATFANSRAFLDWQHAHGFIEGIFTCLPGFAWLLWPVAHLGLNASYAVAVVCLIAVSVAAGMVCARMYGLPHRIGIAMTMAWPPVAYGISVGQNASVGLLLSVSALYALHLRRPALGGIFVGLLLYKPTYAFPVVLFCIVRREWLALAYAAAVMGVWYALSAAAMHTLLWPVPYVGTLIQYFGADFEVNAAQAYSIPGLLLRAGVPVYLAAAAAAALLIAGFRTVRSTPWPHLAAFVLALGVVSNVHALAYDAVLFVPLLCLCLTGMDEPWRTRAIVGSYVSALGVWFSPLLHVDTLVVITVMATIAILTGGSAGIGPSRLCVGKAFNR